jgi:4-alpha-glucanotransferase
VNSPDPVLYELARMYRIATEFHDWRGRESAVSQDTIRAVLAALGVDASTPEKSKQALDDHLQAAWARLVPPCLVTRAGWSPTLDVHVPHGAPVSVWIELESGGQRSDLRQLENWNPPREVNGVTTGEATFLLPSDLPLGYHTLQVQSDELRGQTTVIVTPNAAGIPESMGEGREWGLATQLYSVRSAHSWGVGDLVDLADLAVWAASEHGAGYILVNPLHAAEPLAPMEPSPYLPTSRRFANPLYLRVERIPEYPDLPAAGRAAVERLREQLGISLAGVDRIDRNSSWTSKRAALQLVYAVRRSAGRQIAYDSFRARGGEALQRVALWSAIAEEHGNDWRTWPQELQDPASDAVAEFREQSRTAVDFHCWLQWQLEEQLGMAQSAGVNAGAALGIMHDLAVGVHPGGADSWSMQDVFARGVSVGAPPDAFNQAGQDWAQPPWRPDRLAEVSYQPFRDLVATVLRHAGGVRIDHILGLFRLWWVPEGHSPTEGTYVRYDHEALVGILALEAHRAKAIVVGEDLGTVEPWVRTYLRERGVLGTSILWFEFEFDAGGAPLRPEWWREYCLASVTTHDLPPTAGYLASEHVKLRSELGLLTRSLDEEIANDEAERKAWLDNLRSRGALRDPASDGSAGEPSEEEIVLALHRYLTWTPARLLCASLTDAVGDRRTQNQPGTVDEYPNWRIPLSGPDGVAMTLEQVFASERVARLAAVLQGTEPS